MAWRMDVDRTVRSPMFDFLVDDVPKTFRDRDGRTMATGYRFTGVIPQDLAARQKDKKKLCDAFNIIGFMCVSSKFRGIIESLEPGVHQFFPIALQAIDGARYPDEYFIFNPCAVVDAYLGWASERWPEQNVGKPPFRPYFTGLLEATLSVPEIGDRHLWVGGFQGLNNVHISDDLHKRLEKAKIRYLWCRHFNESDAIWRPEEQMPQVMRWIEADPAHIREMIEKRPDWVRRHRPNWLQ